MAISPRGANGHSPLRERLFRDENPLAVAAEEEVGLPGPFQTARGDLHAACGAGPGAHNRHGQPAFGAAEGTVGVPGPSRVMAGSRAARAQAISASRPSSCSFSALSAPWSRAQAASTSARWAWTRSRASSASSRAIMASRSSSSRFSSNFFRERTFFWRSSSALGLRTLPL